MQYAAILPPTSEPGLPQAFTLTMQDFQQDKFADAEKRLLTLPPKGFTAAFYPVLKQWAQAGSKTLDKPAQIPGFAVRAGELALLMTYHVALINEYAGYPEEASRNYAILQANASALPSRIAQGLLNYLERKGQTEAVAKVMEAYRGSHPDAPVELSGSAEVKPLVSNVKEGVAELLYGMASLYGALNANADATAHLRLALYLRPDLTAGYYMLGMLQEQSKYLADALESYGKVPQGDVLYRRAQLRSAMVEFRMGQEKDAFKRLDVLQKADTKSYDALLARGDLLREQKQYRLAASTYTQALARIAEPRPEHWHIFYARGIAYERAQDWARAEPDLLKALELNPDHPEVMNYLGYSWLVQGGDVERAKNMIAAALEQQPENPAIIDSMGWALFTEGDYDQAQIFIEQALEMMPKDATINDHLGDIYWRLGRHIEAKYQWERALIFNPEEAGQKEAIERKLQEGLPEDDHVSDDAEHEGTTDTAEPDHIH
jgi:tetratricopeptide (TPR) repeat protein